MKLATASIIALLQAIAVVAYIVPPSPQLPTNYPKWAHYQWVWLHNGLSNQENVTNLIDSYLTRGIPVGAVNIDSMWATQFNNFVVDVAKFPDFSGLISYIHSRGAKVTLWATSMINVENPDYQMCIDQQFLVRNSSGQVRPLEWWHGYGGLLDYTNPKAVDWWHKQMDNVLNVGIDGFKCDGTDPYIVEYSMAGGALGYNDQKISYPDYAAMYYRDFFTYTRSRRGGDNGLIMSRPVDCLLDPTSKVCWGYSPRDVMFSGWVGDDDATFQGLRGCARKVIYSAWDGYANFGCDVGGYRGSESEKDKELFLRWAQFGAFLPLMENGGGGEHRPWMYDDETTEIYKTFVKQHHRLSTYFHTVGANGMDNGKSSLTPLSGKESLSPRSVSLGDFPGLWYPQPETYAYLIGDDVLVNPVLHESKNTAINGTVVAAVDAVFPSISGTPTTWLSWWHPADPKQSQASTNTNQHVPLLVPLNSYPVHVRQGALIPLESEDDPDMTVFTWFGPVYSPAISASSPTVAIMRESSSNGSEQQGMKATAYFADSDTAKITISARKGPVAFQLVGINEKPTAVDVQSAVKDICLHDFRAASKTLTVSCSDNSQGVMVTISGLQLVYTA